MSIDDDTLVIEETSLEIEERPAPGPWWIAGVLLFAVAFFLGWRSTRKPAASDSPYAVPKE